MNINCTLIVQGIHFGIAYLMLRTMLCKPAIDVIEQEADHLHALQKAIEQRKQSLLAKQQDKAQQWVTFQQEYAQLIPDLTTQQEMVLAKMPNLIYPTVTQQEIKKAEEVVIATIQPKVMHVGK